MVELLKFWKKTRLQPQDKIYKIWYIFSKDSNQVNGKTRAWRLLDFNTKKAWTALFVSYLHQPVCFSPYPGFYGRWPALKGPAHVSCVLSLPYSNGMCFQILYLHPLWSKMHIQKDTDWFERQLDVWLDNALLRTYYATRQRPFKVQLCAYIFN